MKAKPQKIKMIDINNKVTNKVMSKTIDLSEYSFKRIEEVNSNK
jgi:hypothetical protein